MKLRFRFKKIHQNYEFANIYMNLDKSIVIRKLNEEQFFNIKHEWQALLSLTSSDKLFLSWAWMYHWWKQCSDSDYELLLLAAYDDNELVGIAPLYKKKQKLKLFLPVTRVLFIGTNPGGHSAFRAECLEIIVSPKYKDLVDRFYDYIYRNIGFSELYFQDVLQSSSTFRKIQASTGYKRYLGYGSTYVINTCTSFDDYLKGLGANTRIRSFNHRKKLKKDGKLDLHEVKTNQLTSVFNLLYEFQKDRWGIKEQSFILKREFVERILTSTDIDVSGVILEYNRSPIACTLNLIAGDRVYNLQLAYKQGFDKRFSLGFLIAIYDAEIYFGNEKVKYFDLLEGTGKSYNYKSHLANCDRDLVSVAVIRNPILSFAYRFYNFIKKA
jgi:hypothetical protein